MLVMRLRGLIVAGFVLALSAPALATGNVRIQQSDGSVQTYTGVTMKVANKKLTFISADKVSTVVISGASCGHRGDLIVCNGGGFTFTHEGVPHTIAFKSATFYFNPTDQDQSLPMSTTKLAPHNVVFAIQTKKGTEITGDGKLDQEPAQ
jgi:hypothetical protein